METPRLKSTIERTGKIAGEILISLVKFYQFAISPYVGSNCRHSPTCSNYMIGSIREWGPAKGFWIGMKRLLKCHPGGSSGFDPVPKKDDQK